MQGGEFVVLQKVNTCKMRVAVCQGTAPNGYDDGRDPYQMDSTGDLFDCEGREGLHLVLKLRCEGNSL